MKRQNKEIDKLFSTGLSNYEVVPSPQAWEQIEEQLSPKRNRTYYWVAASIVAVLLTASIAWNNILKRSDIKLYDGEELTAQANYPQKEFIPVPILIHTKSIVYIEKQVPATPVINTYEAQVANETPVNQIVAQPTLQLQPVGAVYAMQTMEAPGMDVSLLNPLVSDEEAVTIIYKKGDPKYPKLTRAYNFMKEVSEGERQLIDFEKISNSLIARRETHNNSNN